MLDNPPFLLLSETRGIVKHLISEELVKWQLEMGV